MNAQSIDLYVNYVCNYRCKHCFLGEDLGKKISMSLDMVEKVVGYCTKNHGTREVVILGGEPTLHKDIVKIIAKIENLGIDRIRLVSNGGKTCRKFIGECKQKIEISFSIDGSNSDTHDLIRGSGALNETISSISLAKEYGHRVTAIASICKENRFDTIAICELAQSLGVETITIHYIAPRESLQKGLGSLEPYEWIDLRKEIECASERLSLEIRFDSIFSEEILDSPRCRIGLMENLMFFPNGDIYECGLFVSSGIKPSMKWDGSRIISSQGVTERGMTLNSKSGCPGISHIFCAAGKTSSIKDIIYASCMYEKKRL